MTDTKYATDDAQPEKFGRLLGEQNSTWEHISDADETDRRAAGCGRTATTPSPATTAHTPGSSGMNVSFRARVPR